MLTITFAEDFAYEWIEAWNSHDLERILSHYADDFTMSSPYIATLAQVPSGALEGKQAIRDYWQKALTLAPTLQFELHSILLGTDSLIIYYHGLRGMAAEVFFFDTEGKVSKACAHYASTN